MKKTKMLRFLALCLAGTMMLSCFAGCGKKEAEVETEVAAEAEDETSSEASEDSKDWDELYTIDVLVDNEYVDLSTDTTIGQWIADEFGIAFNFIQVSGDAQKQQALMLAGGDYNEIQYMQHQTMVQQYMDAGVLLNLDDYKDILPDFYEMFEESIKYWRGGSPDGGLYKWEMAVPRTYTDLLPHYDVFVRSDVLEYYGYPELVTASDWIEFLEKAVVDFPETYDGQATVGMTLPMAESWGIQGIVPIGYEKGDTYIACGNDYYTYNVKTQQFEDYLLNPEAKESFEFFNTLYQKGLLDEECFTDTQDITKQKASNGRAICVWYKNVTSQNATLTEAGHPEMSYIEMPFQLDSQEGQKYVAPAAYAAPYLSFGITDKCEDPERFLKFLNWCCTEEGQLVLQSGLEGVHYTVDEDGMRVPTELRLECMRNTDVANQEGLYSNGGSMWRCLPIRQTVAENGQPYDLGASKALYDEVALTDRQREVYEGLGWEVSNQWWAENLEPADTGYSSSCALDTSSDLGKVGAKMVELRVKYSANLIMADDFDVVWAELMEEYDKLDHEAVIDAMNETLAEYKAAGAQ